MGPVEQYLRNVRIGSGPLRDPRAQRVWKDACERLYGNKPLPDPDDCLSLQDVASEAIEAAAALGL